MFIYPLSIGLGAAVGALAGYFSRCTAGTCPLLATWWRGALYGGCVGFFLAASRPTT